MNEYHTEVRKIEHKQRYTAILLAGLVILISLVVATAAVYPFHAEYSAMGGIVHVEQLGIAGSVYFTYIQEGYVSNFYEALQIYLWLENPIFTRLGEPYTGFNEEDYFLLYEYKEDTLDHALYFATQFIDGELYFDPITELKYFELLEKLEEYIGDSFGLMVAIGLIEELTQRDFSYGGFFTIAGTGTLEWDGTVGSVGGIEQKLLTAASAGVDIFFVPRDDDYLNSIGYEGISNQREAEQVVQKYGLMLEVVPVGTIDEAILYLENLSYRLNFSD